MREAPSLYQSLFENAVRTADEFARRYGVRYRVQSVTWQVGPDVGLPEWMDAWVSWRFYVAPTPAPAPSERLLEPCS